MFDFYSAAAGITTPVALLAFVAALAAGHMGKRADNRRSLLESLDPGDRADALEPFLVKLGVSGANLTRAQKFELILEQLRQQRFRYWLVALALFLVAVCFVTVALVSGPDTDVGPPSSHVPSIVYNGGIASEAWDGDQYSVENSGIVTVEKRVRIDLSKEVYVAPELRDTKKIAKSTHAYTIDATRSTTSSKVMVFEFASQRRQMDIQVQSDQPHAVWFRQDPNRTGDGFVNVWTLVVNVQQHTPGIEFTISFQVDRWNAYQAQNLNFVGHLVSDDANRIVTDVELPWPIQGGAGQDGLRVLTKKKSPGLLEWEDYQGDFTLNVDPDRRAFSWDLVRPEKGHIYAVEIDWIAEVAEE